MASTKSGSSKAGGGALSLVGKGLRVGLLRPLGFLVAVMPFTAWPLVAVLLYASASGGPGSLDNELFTFAVKDTPFVFKVGTLFIALGMLALMLEVIKAAYAQDMSKGALDFMFSFVVAAAHFAVFFFVAGYAVETVFYLCLAALIDVFVGLAITFRVAKLLRRLRGFYAARRLMRG